MKRLELTRGEYTAVMKSLRIFRSLDSQLTRHAKTILQDIEQKFKSLEFKDDAYTCDADDAYTAFIRKLLYIADPDAAPELPWFAKEHTFYRKAARGSTSAWNLLFDPRNIPK